MTGKENDMDDRMLWAVTISATMRDVEGQPIANPFRDQHVIIVQTKEPQRAIGLALEWLGKGWIDKVVSKLECVGTILVVDKS